jgi:hypothetical protein
MARLKQFAEKLELIRRSGSAALQRRVQVLYFLSSRIRLQPVRDLLFEFFSGPLKHRPSTSSCGHFFRSNQ